jgi:hypothetical protein
MFIPSYLSIMFSDLTPALILWFFDSRGIPPPFSQRVFSRITDVLRLLGGWSPGPTSAPLPDWVDATVAEWIKNETAAMEAGWDSVEKRERGALAFVHIPP